MKIIGKSAKKHQKATTIPPLPTYMVDRIPVGTISTLPMAGQEAFSCIFKEHFQFLVVEVYQNSVYVVEFDAHRKVLVDVVQKPFALLQHLRGG